MNEIMKKRVIKASSLLLENYTTIREVAKMMKVGKSTIHHDLTVKLKELDYELYIEVNKQLKYNKEVRHIRGGLATKRKYSAN